MTTNNELLFLIIKKLDIISEDVSVLKNKVDILEGKTSDIHQYIPFVSWLEEVGRNVSQRFKWLKWYKDQPLFIH